MAPELDEFGLPIVRYPTLEEKEAEERKRLEEQSELMNGKATSKSEEKPPNPSNQNNSHRDDAKRDDDDDKFEDALSNQPSPLPRAESQTNPAAPSPPTSSTATTPPKDAEKPKVEDVEADVEADVGAAVPVATNAPKPAPDTVEPVELPKGVSPPPEPPKSERQDPEPKKTGPESNPRRELSEYSHQQLTTPMEEEKKEEGDDGEWQTMPSYARYDMYDDDNRLVAKEFNEADDTETYGYAGLGGAGKGYTRVVLDDDAESVTSMDENTQYLFKEANGTSALDYDEARDAVSQMQATKNLLTEGQRVAYVGVVRLEIANMIKEAESTVLTRSTKKEVGFAAESMQMWGQKMMLRLYKHMDITEAEQIMIEQLAQHGVLPGDLTPALLANSRVSNPMADEKASRRSSAMGFGSEEKFTEPPPPYESHDSAEMPEVKTPSQMPTTSKIDIDLRWTVLCDLFLILIADSIYDARSRVLLEKVAESLEISWIDICRFEKKVTDALEMQQAAEKENWNEDEHMENRRKRALKKRYMMMGLATVGGGLVIGLSAGLLAPVIGAGLAAGFTTIGVTGTSSFLAGAGGAAIITSSAAASGSIIGGRAANRRTGAVKTFEYRPLHNNKRVNLIVTVSGWLTGKVDDVRLPFSTVDSVMGDLYAVLWEPEMLRSMGDTINILATEALTQGLQQILGSTILVALMSALQLPIVLTKLSYLIDNPWAVSLDRATAAGKILADSLMERNLGTRPITLVGYSLGSRVIFSCLQELSKRGALGIVQNVFLFGSPVVVKKDEYIRARTVVSGRFVNAFNRNDWILGYLFRLTNGGIRRVAGLGPIEDLPWIENMDVTDIVSGHMDYRKQMPSLLMKCGWSVESEEFTEIEDPDPENHTERQRELINEIEEARKNLEKEGKAGKGSRFSIFGRRKKAERQAWEIYEEGAGKQQSKGDEKADINSGVLFDIDAIRAELAKEARYGDTEELQVREIKSTLPPMKLDISSMPSSSRSSPAPASAPESTLAPAAQNPLASRETRSIDALPTRESYERRPIVEAQSYSRQPSYSYSRPLPPPIYGENLDNDEIQMIFDTSFDDPRPTVSTAPVEDEVQMTFGTSFSNPDPVVPTAPTMDEFSSRPELTTTQTLPNMMVTNPWGDPDDDDFGKEQEISMTFA